MKDIKFYGKTIYLPKHKILAIGDLHLGYEEKLKHQGIAIPLKQLEKTKNQIKEILEKLKKQGHKIKKIILLGDIQHNFEFQIGERIEIKSFIKFLSDIIGGKNLILIKGNHDKIEFGDKKYQNYYIKDGFAFIHGNQIPPRVLNKKIKTIVMGHIHPAVIIKDPKGIKKEKFKCFLTGKYKGKKWIVVPSFLPIIEGVNMNDYCDSKKKRKFSVIPEKKLKNFETFIVGKDKVYHFGKLKDLK